MQEMSKLRAIQSDPADDNATAARLESNMELFQNFKMENLAVTALMMFFATFGIILNSLALMSCFRKRQKMLFTFLFGLAMVDFINCIFLGLESAKRLGTMEFISADIWCRVFPYWTFVGNLTGAFYAVLVSFARYTKVHLHQATLPYARTVCLLISTLICSSLICLPILVSKNYVALYTCFDNNANTDAYIYVNVFSGVILTCLALAFVLLIVSNARLTKAASVRLEPSRRVSTVSKRKSVTFSDWTQNSECTASRTSQTYLPGDQFLGQRDIFDGCGQLLTLPDGQRCFVESDCDSRRGSLFTSSSSIFKPIRPYVPTSGDRSRPSSTWSEQGYRVGTPCFTTAMVVCAVVIFVFHFPYICMNIIYATLPELRNYGHAGIRILFGVLEHSYMLLFVLNPIIYRFSNRNFKRDLGKSCCRCCRREPKWMRKNSFQARRSSRQVEGHVTNIRAPSLFTCSVTAELKQNHLPPV